jgi:transposase
MRGLRSDYGIVLPQGVTKFRQGLLPILEQEQAQLIALGRAIFQQRYAEWLVLEERLAYYNEQLETVCQSHPVCQRLRTIPGIGPLTATALVAAVNDATHFKNGRQFAAWLGLVPRQHSTGGKPHLLGISERGNRYLRKLLMHGARATLRWTKRKNDRRSQWVRALIERRGTNRAVVALANKNARIAWVLLTTDQVYAPADTMA